MLKAALAGALALAGIGPCLAATQMSDTTSAHHARAAAGVPVVTSAHIGRLKNVLRLTAEQVRYWPPVERVLRALARERAQLDDVSLRRLMIAALPLIHSLNDEQKQRALTEARAMGFSVVASAM
jgi:hypothetical protein